MTGLTLRVRHVLKTDRACRRSPARTILRVQQLEGAPIQEDLVDRCDEFSRPGDIERTMRRLQRLGLYPPDEEGQPAHHRGEDDNPRSDEGGASDG